MIQIQKLFRRVLAVSLVAGAVGLAAAPAQANPSFNFSFSLGTPRTTYNQYTPPANRCMSNSRIEIGLGNQGYYNVRYVGETYYGYPEFQAVYGSWYYTMQVNRCTGNVYNRQQIRPVVVRPAPTPTPPSLPGWRFHQQPRPFGGDSDVIYHRN